MIDLWHPRLAHQHPFGLVPHRDIPPWPQDVMYFWPMGVPHRPLATVAIPQVIRRAGQRVVTQEPVLDSDVAGIDAESGNSLI